MKRLRIGDNVKILVGKDKGRTGDIVAFVKNKEYVIVKGVNMVTKFIKKGMMGEGKEGGKIKVEAPLHISNVQLICPSCKKSVRVRIIEKDGKRWRVCTKCGHLIDKDVGTSEKESKKTKTKKTTKKKSKI